MYSCTIVGDTVSDDMFCIPVRPTEVSLSICMFVLSGCHSTVGLH